MCDATEGGERKLAGPHVGRDIADLSWSPDASRSMPETPASAFSLSVGRSYLFE